MPVAETCVSDSSFISGIIWGKWATLPRRILPGANGLPESMRSWGEWKTPADRMTSFRALRMYDVVPVLTETPAALPRELTRILDASVRLYTLSDVCCSAQAM